MTTPDRPGWWVVCDHYQRGPFKSAETAQRELEAIERCGACSGAHRVEEVPSR